MPQEGSPRTIEVDFGVYEVLGSDWAQRLEQQNRVSFPDFRWAPKRHFRMLTHESTGEFLAAGLVRVFKLIERASGRGRAVSAPQLVTLVRAGARFERCLLVEAREADAA